MEVSKEKLEELADIIKKIRIYENADGVRYFNEDGAMKIETLSKDVDIIRENFAYFAKRPTSIMYPDDFLKIMKNLPGGNQLIADNLEYILKSFINKKQRARIELIGIPQVSKKVAGNFGKFLNLSTFAREENQDFEVEDSRTAEELRYVPCCAEQNQTDFSIFLGMLGASENPSEVLEANKELFLNYAYNSGMLTMVKTLSRNPKCHEFIKNNFETIRDICYTPHLAELYTLVRDICPEQFTEHSFTIDKIFLPAIEKLNMQGVQGKEYSNILSQINLTCSEIIKQNRSKDFDYLAKYMMTSTKNDNLKVCGSGFFNITLQVGEKALKIGGKEYSKEDDEPIPYHPRILLPTTRKMDASKDPKHPLFVALYEMVDVDIDITDEELLEVYKDLREDGIRWLDVKKENLGRLRKDNLQYEIGYNVPCPLELLGFVDSGVEKRTLKAGDLVVIDLDYLYKDGKADDRDFVSEKVPQCIRDYEAEYMRRKEEQKKLTRKPEAPSAHDEY